MAPLRVFYQKILIKRLIIMSKHTTPTSPHNTLNQKTKEHNEGQKIVGHSYDGIDELDNALPSLWISGFYLTIIFATGYFFYYSMHEGPTLTKEYDHTKNDYDYNQSLKKQSTKTASEEE